MDSVSRLFPNSFAFIEATGQVYRGESAIFKAEERSDLAYVGHLRAYRDLTESTNIDLGGSFAQGHNDAGGGATTQLWGADAAFRYRPAASDISSISSDADGREERGSISPIEPRTHPFGIKASPRFSPTCPVSSPSFEGSTGAPCSATDSPTTNSFSNFNLPSARTARTRSKEPLP